MAKKVNPLKFFNDQNNTRVNKMQEGGSPKMIPTKIEVPGSYKPYTSAQKDSVLKSFGVKNPKDFDDDTRDDMIRNKKPYPKDIDMAPKQKKSGGSIKSKKK